MKASVFSLPVLLTGDKSLNLLLLCLFCPHAQRLFSELSLSPFRNYMCEISGEEINKWGLQVRGQSWIEWPLCETGIFCLSTPAPCLPTQKANSWSSFHFCAYVLKRHFHCTTIIINKNDRAFIACQALNLKALLFSLLYPYIHELDAIMNIIIRSILEKEKLSNGDVNSFTCSK